MEAPLASTQPNPLAAVRARVVDTGKQGYETDCDQLTDAGARELAGKGSMLYSLTSEETIFYGCHCCGCCCTEACVYEPAHNKYCNHGPWWCAPCWWCPLDGSCRDIVGIISQVNASKSPVRLRRYHRLRIPFPSLSLGNLLVQTC